ncbi:fasciclin domain-containing protein [Mariniflexile sp. HNIBRBA6329]|uniref:fasciclin domain-containing protein n=1 Tax=Mariniflexile sp. HNIBRBA6329 TaxID=3373088 RepID=UPI0037456D52
MKSIIKYSKIIFPVMAMLLAVSCSDSWEGRSSTNDNNLKQTLSERIKNTSETSEFAKLLTETGLDIELSNSKTYTVWVPTNEAMNQVDPAFLSDLNSKRLFVQNHIALTAFSSVSTQNTVTIQMLSNKYLEFKNGTAMDDANVVTADEYASNGLFHIINKSLEPKSNIWQYLKSKIGSNAMSAYLSTLDEFNLYTSDSIAKANEFHELYADSLTNSYLTNVYNLNNERNRYTFFLLEDDAYSSEVQKLEPYLIKSNTDSTSIYASYFNVRDFAFPKAITRENLPDTLTSRFGVKVPINKANIVEEVQLSNGIVYIMNSLDVPLETRLLTTQIEGEKPRGFSQNDKRANTFYREKEDLNGVLFYDIMVQNHRTALFAINYSANNLYSTTYKVYWRAVNDIQVNTYQQRLRIGDATDPIALLPYTDVAPNVYDEIYIGEFTLNESGSLGLISLIADNTSVDGNNTLTLDYLKLVPVIK